MEARRTVEVKVVVDESDVPLLNETIDEFRWAANYVVDAAWDGEWVETRRAVLHELTYSAIRAKTRLHSNHVQSARDWARDALKSVVANWTDGRYASLPTFTAASCEYNQRTATFYKDHAVLSTVSERVRAEYVLPSDMRDTPHCRYLFQDSWEVTGATLHRRRGEFYLHIRTKADVDVPGRSEDGTVLGVDLGVENTAVTSTGVFWSAAQLNHWKNEYAKRRKSLQARSTRYTHEHIQSVGQKESERIKHYLHRVSNELVNEAEEHGCSFIAFENLRDIRYRMPNTRKFQDWAFRRLLEYVRYKAERHGIRVEQVNPGHTSQRCSSCGFTDGGNRQTQDTFVCQKCGYQNHADYNAAKNIGLELLRRRQKGADGGAPVGVRLNTGVMTTNGVEPVPDSARVETHGECTNE